MKAETSFIEFKEYINQWFGPIYKCNLCVIYDYDLWFDPYTENGFTFFVFSFSVK